MIKFFGYKKCGTCRKAEKALQEAGVNYEFIDITVENPDSSLIKEVWKHSEIELKKCFNTSGVSYREGGFKDKLKTMSEEEMLQALAADGKLCKRPMLIDGSKASVGYKQGDFESLWT